MLSIIVSERCRPDLALDRTMVESREIWESGNRKIQRWWPLSADELSSSGQPRSWDAESLNDLLSKSPESCNDLLKMVYYGSSDDRELGLFKEYRDAFHFQKRRNLILTSVVGGFFCFNIAVALKPARIYLFDANPMQLLSYTLVRRVILDSSDKNDFLRRIRNKSYDINSNWEDTLRKNLSIKLKLDEGIQSTETLPGFNKRPLERSWRYALNRFERLQEILANTPCSLLIDDTRNEKFVDFLFSLRNNWIYLSNVWELAPRLRQENNLKPPPAPEVVDSDHIISYSRPYVIRLRKFPAG